MIFDIDKLNKSKLVNEVYEEVKDEGHTKNEIISLLVSEGWLDGQGIPTEKAYQQANLFLSPMVKGAYQIALERGLNTNPVEIARILISKGVITEDGQPTKKAFDLGLITEEELHHD